MSTPPPTGHYNSGLKILNPKSCPAKATIAATGMGRSGTTMVARLMSAIGVEMAETINNGAAEDRNIDDAVRSKDQRLEKFSRICRERDQKFKKWGFKSPTIRGMLGQAVTAMREPRLIITFRDPLAVALRNEIYFETDFMDLFDMAARGNVKLIRSLGEISAPILLISYEKALQAPESLVKTLATFCGINLDTDIITRIAAKEIRNSDPRYMEKAGLTKAEFAKLT